MGPAFGRGSDPPRWEGEEVALRISFSVAAFWSWSFRRSFSWATFAEFFSRAASLASRSLTWRSLRSRKARWLGFVRWVCAEGSGGGGGGGGREGGTLRDFGPCGGIGRGSCYRHHRCCSHGAWHHRSYREACRSHYWR